MKIRVLPGVGMSKPKWAYVPVSEFTKIKRYHWFLEDRKMTEAWHHPAVDALVQMYSSTRFFKKIKIKMSIHKNHNVHQNSRKSYKKLVETLGGRQFGIWHQISLYNSGKIIPTDRAVAIAFGMEDMNYVRPRITELIQKGLVIEGEGTFDTFTNRTVRTLIAVKANNFVSPKEKS